MLIEFSVENHRAFREKQTFSMVASAATERAGPEHVSSTGFSAVPFVLREACLFGANGSGKSSLIEALAFMSRFVRNSFRKEAGSGIAVEPFLFHSEWRHKPSEFEVIFIHDETQYQYGFAVTRERVIEEWLFARPKKTGRQRHLFTRSYDAEKDAYDWDISSVHLKGERDSWKAQTRPDALLLSTAVQLNADSLKGVFSWITETIRIMTHMPPGMRPDVTAKRSLDKSEKERVLAYLKEADFALTDLTIEEKPIDLLEGLDGAPESFVELMTALDRHSKASGHEISKRLVVSTKRPDETGTLISLPMEEESTGTRAFFELAAPILDALDKGHVLVVDELNSGLHPLAFQHLIAMFCKPEFNTNHAQLIFTTHDTSVTERSCIGRDQIWLVEKGDDLAAQLVPFSDFKTRDERPFRKGYLQGRYGAIPRIAG